MKYDFPKDFWWGSAFSGPQTESGTDPATRAESIWKLTYDDDKYKFVNQQYCVNDFLHNYSHDIALAKQLSFNSLRTSIQWSRLMPDGKHVDQNAVVFYNNVINEMIKQKITPVINLFHFDMPIWAQKMGGWLNRDVVNRFVDYAKNCFTLFGDRVHDWISFNEPIVPAECGYLSQYHFPFVVDMRQFCQVAWNTLIAHLKVAQVFRSTCASNALGIVLNVTPAIPRSDNPADVRAAEIAAAFQAKSFLDPIIKHHYPQVIVDLAEKYGFMWKIEKGDQALIDDHELTVDFLGINYYAPIRVKCVDFVPDFAQGAITLNYFFEQYVMPGRRFNPYRGWEIYPKGLYMCMKDIQENYGNIRFYISENGMGVESEERFLDTDGVINDQYRIDFIAEHLAWISKAIKEGANCFGYHVWAYIDNWSWLNAYKNRYGLIRFDLSTNKRILKKSAAWIKDIIEANAVTFEALS